MKNLNSASNKWVNTALSLRDILGQLGATLDACGRVGFEDDDPILEMCPALLDNNEGILNPQFIESAEELADKLILIKEEK